MKKVICLIFMIVFSVSIVTAPAATTAASTDGSSITGIGSGSFPPGANIAGINLTTFDVATGVFTEGDGSAEGVFYADLSGRTALGSVRLITLEGDVTRGTAAAGSSSFSGLGSLSLGDGIPPVPGVPFTVETNGSSMVLTIQSSSLPSTAFSEGALDIK